MTNSIVDDLQNILEARMPALTDLIRASKHWENQDSLFEFVDRNNIITEQEADALIKKMRLRGRLVVIK